MHNTISIPIHSRLSMALCDAATARECFKEQPHHHIFDSQDYLSASGDIFGPVRIEKIAQFVYAMHRCLRHNPGKTIVICAGADDAESATSLALLLGGFMILGRGIGFEEVMLSFKQLSAKFVPFQDPESQIEKTDLTVQDCWRALCHAKCLGWLDLTREFPLDPEKVDLGKFDLEAHEHFSALANGQIYMVVPSKIIAFPRPVDLPSDFQWRDDSALQIREFSPGYFAEVFKNDFGVSLVVSLDKIAYDTSFFTTKGIKIEESLSDGEPLHLLQSVVHFLSLTGRNSGLVAIHNTKGTGPNNIGLLIATHLINQFNFGARGAAAWVRMVNPSLALSRQQQAFLTTHQHRFAYLTKPSLSPPTLLRASMPSLSSSSTLLHRSYPTGDDKSAPGECPAVSQSAAETVPPPSALPRSSSAKNLIVNCHTKNAARRGLCDVRLPVGRCASESDLARAWAEEDDDIFALRLNDK